MSDTSRISTPGAVVTCWREMIAERGMYSGPTVQLVSARSLTKVKEHYVLWQH